MPTGSDSTTPGDDGSLRSLLISSDRAAELDRLVARSWGSPTPTSTGLVWVTANGGPDTVLDRIESAPGQGMPDSVEVISLNDCDRSTAAQGGPSSTTVPFEPSALTVHTLPSAPGLGGLAATILESVGSLEEAGHQVVIVFDDLGAVLETAGPKEAHRFLHILTGKAGREGWTLRAAMDEATVEPGIQASVRPLFDEIA